jgi:hypothetical protein
MSRPDHWPREFPSSAIIGEPGVVSNLAVWHKNAQPLNKKIEHTTENVAFVDNREDNNNSVPFVFTLPADPAVQIQTADEYLEGQK